MPLYAICPFFEWEKHNPPRFKCELKMMKFSTNADKSTYMNMRCCSWDYEECENAKKLLKKWGVTDGI